MNKREYIHIAGIVILALALRAWAFKQVAIWGDIGFYVADTNKILAGQRPFFDFLGRSPLFLYGLAAWRTIISPPLIAVRTYVIGWWVLTLLPIYALARHIRDHKTGLVAAGLWAAVPFTFLYGMWANTQSLAAFLAVTGVFCYLYVTGHRGAALAGVAFGLAFLSRRSVIVILPAIPLWLAIEWYRGNTTHRTVVTQPITLFVAFAGTLMAGYYLLSPTGFSGAIKLAQTHATSLIVSNGRGGYPLIGVNPPSVINTMESGRIPIFHDLCQLCSFHTVAVYAKTLLRASPLLAPLAVYLRDLDEQIIDPDYRLYLHGILGILVAYGIAVSFWNGFYWRGMVLAGYVVAVGLVYTLPRVPGEILYAPRLTLVLVVLFGYMSGYLYRNRLLHVYYFMDLVPFVCVVAGVVLVALARRIDWPDRIAWYPAMRTTVLVFAGAGLLVSGSVMAHPDAINPVTEGSDWYTFENIREYEEFFNTHTEPGDEVLASKIAYVATSHAHLPNKRPRYHYLIATFQNTGPGARAYAYSIKGVQSGKFKFMIASPTNQNVIEMNHTLTKAVNANYCYYQNESVQRLFNQTNGEVWIHKDYVSECQQVNIVTFRGETYPPAYRYPSARNSPLPEGVAPANNTTTTTP